MRRHRSTAVIAGLVVACGATENRPAPTIQLRPSLVIPRAFTDAVTSLQLTVLAKEGAAVCAVDTGLVAERDKARVVTQTALKTKCGDGERFCGDLSLDRVPDVRIFVAEGTDAAGRLVATACAEASADAEELAVDLVLRRFVPPATCRNDALEATEQCESDDVACDACHTAEVIASVPGPAGTDGVLGRGAAVSLGASGTSFIVAYATAAAGASELAARGLNPRAAPLPAPLSDAVYLPKAGATQAPPQTKAQGSPALAGTGGRAYVAYEDDSTGSFDVRVRSFDGNFASPDDVVVASEPAAERSPAIAAGVDGKLFVAWLDEGARTFKGRLLTPPSALGTVQDLGGGASLSSLGIAPRGTGYVAVWQNGTSAVLRLVDANGTPVGANLAVGEGDATVPPSPRIAADANGGFAVAFLAKAAKGHRVVLRRYDRDGIAEDEGLVVDEAAAADAASPSITALPGGNGYAVFWIEGAEVRGRYVGTNDFLSNPITGHETSFQVSTLPGRTRSETFAVTGGDFPWVMVFWTDAGDAGASSALVFRRLPPPLLPY